MPLYAEPVGAAPKLDDETVALRASEVSEARRRAEQLAGRATNEGMPAPGGRAARRKAARRHGRHGGAQEPQEPLGAQESVESAEKAAQAPLSRVQARRAARARKPGVAVLVSRMIGEVFITTGVLMLLFVTYQLWWSNVRAHQQAGSAAHHLQEDWASGKRSPGTFEPGQGFAILHIPKLDVVAPIAEGTSKTKVLDRGMVGHYGEGALKTAMPDAKTGNFGLAGHRNTHGEPFRHNINRLKPGDSIVVETQDDYFVYKMTSILPVTSPSNTKVLDPIPQGSGFTAPGRYITLTTCTPEFTSTYRMIVRARWSRNARAARASRTRSSDRSPVGHQHVRQPETDQTGQMHSGSEDRPRRARRGRGRRRNGRSEASWSEPDRDGGQHPG